MSSYGGCSDGSVCAILLVVVVEVDVGGGEGGGDGGGDSSAARCW